jgi:hypothetical protein
MNINNIDVQIYEKKSAYVNVYDRELNIKKTNSS